MLSPLLHLTCTHPRAGACHLPVAVQEQLHTGIAAAMYEPHTARFRGHQRSVCAQVNVNVAPATHSSGISYAGSSRRSQARDRHHRGCGGGGGAPCAGGCPPRCGLGCRDGAGGQAPGAGTPDNCSPPCGSTSGALNFLLGHGKSHCIHMPCSTVACDCRSCCHAPMHDCTCMWPVVCLQGSALLSGKTTDLDHAGLCAGEVPLGHGVNGVVETR